MTTRALLLGHTADLHERSPKKSPSALLQYYTSRDVPFSERLVAIASAGQSTRYTEASVRNERQRAAGEVIQKFEKDWNDAKAKGE
jgi:hypothetical protein